jgi:hypothetical protein
MFRIINISLLFFFISATAQAQKITIQTISAAGSYFSAGGLQLESSMGGLAVMTTKTPVFMYTQDFLQPDAGVTSSIPIINDVVLNSGAGLDNAGSSFANGNARIDFTLGEFASITYSQGSSMLTQGILQPLNIGAALPITKLEFYAKRVNNSQVQLDWKTLQETNNKGFHIERKKENEIGFTSIGFVPSMAPGGNSGLPLKYQKLDNNSFNGNTYYQLRQEDIDGKASYSVLRIVKGDESKQVVLQVWPIPAVGYFNVSVNGLVKPDVLFIVDMSGKTIRQIPIQNQSQQQVSGLTAGVYYVRLGSDNGVGQKVIVQ